MMNTGIFKYTYAILLAFLFALSCKEEITAPKEHLGSFVVAVISEYNSPMDSVVVFLRNTDFRSVTDTAGYARFEYIPTGSYEIVAYKKNLGSGSGEFTVRFGSMDTLKIIFKYDVFFEPTIYAPTGNNFATNDTVKVTVRVTDTNTPAESIRVEFGKYDKTIQSGYPDENGFITFASADYPVTIDTLFVTATNLDNVSNTKGIIINKTRPYRVTLEMFKTEYGILSFRWDASTDTNFSYYTIQRNAGFGFTNLASIKVQSVNSYIDSSTLFTPSLAYRVITKNTNIYEGTFSNEITINQPNGLSFYANYRNTLIHPTKPYLYFFELINYDGYVNLILYDYEQKVVLGQTYVGRKTGYVSIGQTFRGLEIVVPMANGMLNIYDAENLTMKKSFSTGVSANCSAITENGFVFLAHNDGFRSYNSETGAVVDSKTLIRPDRIHKFSGKNALFGYYGPGLYYINYNAEGKITSYKTAPTFRYTYPYVFSVSSSENYSIIGSSGDIYKTDSSLSYISTVPFSNSAVTHSAFNTVDDRVFLSNHEQRVIRVFSYPQLVLNRVIRTKGYPLLLFVRNNELIVISRTSSTSSTYGVEKFGINW